MKNKLQLRRSLLQTAGLAALLGAAGNSGLISRALAAVNEPGLRRYSGEVNVNGKPARVGMPIVPGDTVVTGADGEAIYVIGLNAHLQRSGSRVSFGGSAAAGVLHIISGRLLSVFAQGTHSIMTPTATIGIRGTGCYIEAEAERVYFCLCYGEAELTPTVSPEEREIYRSRHHDRPLYIYSDMKMPKMAVPADVINHSDEELTLLEALVGRSPPFAAGSKY